MTSLFVELIDLRPAILNDRLSPVKQQLASGWTVGPVERGAAACGLSVQHPASDMPPEVSVTDEASGQL